MSKCGVGIDFRHDVLGGMVHVIVRLDDEASASGDRKIVIDVPYSAIYKSNPDWKDVYDIVKRVGR